MEGGRAVFGQKSVSVLLRFATGLIMAVLLAGLAVTLTHRWTTLAAYWPPAGNAKQLKETIKQFGKLAEFGVFGAAGYWVLKTAVTKLPVKLLRPMGFLRTVMLFLKRNHTWIGMFTLVAAVSHGAYFIMYPDKKVSYLYTGIGAWFGLFIAAGIGMAAYVRQKKRSSAFEHSRKWHKAAAALFVVLFLIHLYY